MAILYGLAVSGDDDARLPYIVVKNCRKRLMVVLNKMVKRGGA